MLSCCLLWPASLVHHWLRTAPPVASAAQAPPGGLPAVHGGLRGKGKSKGRGKGKRNSVAPVAAAPSCTAVPPLTQQQAAEPDDLPTLVPVPRPGVTALPGDGPGFTVAVRTPGRIASAGITLGSGDCIHHSPESSATVISLSVSRLSAIAALGSLASFRGIEVCGNRVHASRCADVLCHAAGSILDDISDALPWVEFTEVQKCTVHR